MGMTCFFRDMMWGRNAQFSSVLILKACRIVSSSPTKSSCVPYSSTSVIISTTVLKWRSCRMVRITVRNSSFRSSSRWESMQVI